jgi:hypothetical protein
VEESVTTGSWTRGTSGDELGTLRAEIGRQAFVRWYFWMVVGRHRSFWLMGAYLLCFRLPIRVFASRRQPDGWGSIDVVGAAVLVLLPLAVYAFGHWTYGKLTSEQRRAIITFRRSGVDFVAPTGGVTHVAWDAIAKAQEADCSFYLTGGQGGVTMVPKIDASDPHAIVEVRGILRQFLGPKARVREGASG